MHGVLPQDTNPILDITHSPMYPLVVLTVYMFGIGFTIGNFAGYFRFNKDVYGEDFTRAYLAFTIIGAGAYFFVAGVCWLWAAKYVSSIDSRVRKLTVGFIVIFLFHDLPCFSMELHAILTHGWRNGYQGFVFVIQILTFLLSFVNGWLYYTYVMAGWLQYWYGSVEETYTLKTGAEQLEILPPMSPAERPVLATPMLDRGLVWGRNINTGGTTMSSGGRSMMMGGATTLSVQRGDMSSPRGGGGGGGGSLHGSPSSRSSYHGDAVVVPAGPNSVLRSMQREQQPGSGMRGMASPVHSDGLGINGSARQLRTYTMRPVDIIQDMEDPHQQQQQQQYNGGMGDEVNADPYGVPLRHESQQYGNDPYTGAGPSPPSLMRSGNATPRSVGGGIVFASSQGNTVGPTAFSRGNDAAGSPSYPQSSGNFALNLRPIVVSRSPAPASGSSWRNLPQL